MSQAGINGIPGGSIAVVETLTPDSGGPVSPVANNINVFGKHGINTSNGGAGELDIQINNAITLGDLSAIAAGSNALSATTGDINITAGSLKLVATNSTGSTGTIQVATTRYWTVADVANDNFFVGQNAGNPAAIVPGGGTANANQGFGGGSMFYLTTGMDNTGCGHNSLRGNSGSNLTGSFNTALGGESLTGLASGSFNCAVGYDSGAFYTSNESSNITLGYLNRGTALENNTLRIGNGTGAGNGNLNKAFIAGINGVTASNAKMVTINSSTDQLGVQAIPQGANTWTVVTGASQTIAVNNGYIANNAGTISFALPATSAVGDIFEITSINNTTGWTVTQALGQQIRFGSSQTTSGAGGSLSASANGDSIRAVCTVANTNWNIISSIGNITIV